MLTLYHGEPNTFSLKPLIALHEKKLEFTSHYVDFTKFEHLDLPQARATEVEYNPEGEGPILVHHDTAMTESFFINLYLDEAFPEKPLRPTSAEGRWRVLAWGRFVNEVLAPSVCTLGSHKYLAPLLKGRSRTEVEAALARIPALEARQGWQTALDDSYTGEVLEDSRRKIGIALKKAEDALAKGNWLAGPDFSLADIDVFALLHPVTDLEPKLLNDRAAPRTAGWLEKIRGRAAVKAALAASKSGNPEQSFTPGPEHSRWG
jgi:GST-like protein